MVQTVHLPENEAGKDYIFGDLHGCVSLLESLLDHVNFDPAVDRLFSVGDLADRGPESLRALQLLENDWLYAVMGNHERNLLDWVEAGKPALQTTLFGRNGGDWAENAPLDDELLSRVAALPYVISVGQGKSRFNIVHAELIEYTDNDIDSGFRGHIPEMVVGRLTMSRNLSQVPDLYPAWNNGLSLTYCGHTVRKASQTAIVASHYNIDTGAYRSAKDPEEYGLTMVCHQTDEEWLNPF